MCICSCVPDFSKVPCAAIKHSMVLLCTAVWSAHCAIPRHAPLHQVCDRACCHLCKVWMCPRVYHAYRNFGCHWSNLQITGPLTHQNLEFCIIWNTFLKVESPTIDRNSSAGIVFSYLHMSIQTLRRASTLISHISSLARVNQFLTLPYSKRWGLWIPRGTCTVMHRY